MTPAQFAEIIARIAKLEAVVEERLTGVNAAVGALIAAFQAVEDDEPEIGFTPDFHS